MLLISEFKELLTKELPYSHLPSAQAVASIIADRVPIRPQSSIDWPARYNEAWKLCEECWAKDPTNRPKINNIIMQLSYRGRLRATLASNGRLDLTDRLKFDKKDNPLTGGAFGEIRTGTCAIDGRGEVKVAVKSIRIYRQELSDPEVVKVC